MELTFTEAILNATRTLMERDPKTILFGLGVNDDRGLQGTTKDLVSQFGEDRVFDIPIAEDAMMGFAVGAALGGAKPIFNHARMDFLLLTFNQLFNVATKYNYMFNGNAQVPLIVRCLVGYGWGAQHSQVLTSILSSFPGISVLCPSSPYDAKGLLLKAADTNSPVVFVEDFQLYTTKGMVGEGYYTVNFDDVEFLERGNAATLITLSSATLAVKELISRKEITDIDVMCIKSVTDINYDMVAESLARTRKLIFVQNAWLEFGLGSNIARKMLLRGLEFQYQEVGFPFCPTPYADPLEKNYYVSSQMIRKAINKFLA